MFIPFFFPKEQEFIHGTTWMNLKCILPSERSQRIVYILEKAKLFRDGKQINRSLLGIWEDRRTN